MVSSHAGKKKGVQEFKRNFSRNWQLYVLILLPLAYILTFKYGPMYGIQIAFKDYSMRLGYWDSPFAGVKHFKTFLSSPYFSRLMLNTIGISLYSIIANFFPPIILAICLNECRSRFFKKTAQMITYAPYFLSTVIVVGILQQVLSRYGLVNTLLDVLGFERIGFLGDASLFKSIYVWSGVWQNIGYNSIMYLAALAGISSEVQEAAVVDGANIWKRIWHVDIPGILPTAVILLILSTASVLNVGFEKVFLLQNPLNTRTSDVISTYTYRIGLVDLNYSFATAVGLFQSVVSLGFMAVVNKIAEKTTETSLW